MLTGEKGEPFKANMYLHEAKLRKLLSVNFIMIQ